MAHLDVYLFCLDIYMARLLVLPPAILYSVFGYSNFYTKKDNMPTDRLFRRNFKQKFWADDRRLMLLSAYMLFECMAPFFSLKCLRNFYFWFPFDQHLFYEHVIPILSWGIERKPPWPPPGHISYCLGIGLFCGYILSGFLSKILDFCRVLGNQLRNYFYKFFLKFLINFMTVWNMT